MAYIDNYSNGYKDGYSSADDPNRRDYSPSGVDAQRRDAFFESNRREREMAKYQAGLDNERIRQEEAINKAAREETINRQHEAEAREYYATRRKAINILVQQKRDEYKKKNLFSKAIANIRGKSFDQMKRQISQSAEERVDKMTADQLERFIEKNTEDRGMRR